MAKWSDFGSEERSTINDFMGTGVGFTIFKVVLALMAIAFITISLVEFIGQLVQR